MESAIRWLCILLAGVVVGGGGSLFLGLERVSWQWIGGYAITCLVALFLLNSSLKRWCYIDRYPWKIVLGAALVIAVGVTSWSQAAPVRDVHAAKEHALTQASIAAQKAEEQVYQNVIADLKKQGFISAHFEELTHSGAQKFKYADANAVQVQLLARNTRQPNWFYVQQRDGKWTIVCPLQDGGWLYPDDRGNWLSVQLAQIGACPPGIR